MTETRRSSAVRTVLDVSLVAGGIRWLVVIAAIGVALEVHRRIPWIRPAYLSMLIVLPIAAWSIWRRRRLARRWRWSGTLLTVAGFVALCPVPWMKLQTDDPPGTAWQLDGRLVIDGRSVDPPGTWYWLTVGRPPLFAELAWSWFGNGSGVLDLRDGPAGQRPSVVEPAAAAVGLRLAGRPLPSTATADARIGGPFVATLPVSWFRNLALGRSHGLMVALVSYAHESGDDLARGRSIAATGAITSDGTVRPIGGLTSKATAAKRVGADVLLFPAIQVAELADFDYGTMRLVPVNTLSDAVAALAAPTPRADLARRVGDR